MRLRKFEPPIKRAGWLLPSSVLTGDNPAFGGLLAEEPIYVPAVGELVARIWRFENPQPRLAIVDLRAGVEILSLRRDETVESICQYKQYLFCSLDRLSDGGTRTVAFARVDLRSRQAIRFPIMKRKGVRQARIYGVRGKEEILLYAEEGEPTPKRWDVHLGLNRWRPL